MYMVNKSIKNKKEVKEKKSVNNNKNRCNYQHLKKNNKLLFPNSISTFKINIH